MTLEQYLENKKKQFTDLGGDLNNFRDLQLDHESKRQFKGFNNDQLAMYIETIDTQISMMQERLAVAENERSRRGAENDMVNLKKVLGLSHDDSCSCKQCNEADLTYGDWNGEQFI